MAIKKWDKNLRPREKAINNGIESLSDYELLALILRCGNKEKDAIELSKEILQKSAGLSNLLDMSLSQLMKIEGIGKATACQIRCCLEMAKRKNYEQVINCDALKTPEKIISWLKTAIGSKDQEFFVIIYLNIRNQVIYNEILYKGSNDSISFNNREIFLNAFNNHASKIVIAHNHPSQNVSPSLADKKATIEIKKASLLIGIELVDHIIVSYNDYFSFKENGLI